MVLLWSHSLKRLKAHPLLVTSLLVSIIMATTIATSGPMYLKSLKRLALNQTIDTISRPFSNINIVARRVPLTENQLNRTQNAIVAAIEKNFYEIYESHEIYLRVDAWLAGLPSDPLPPAHVKGEASRAYFRYLSNLDNHVIFKSGRMATDLVKDGQHGPVLEAVISVATSREFILDTGQEITVSPSLGSKVKLTVEIVGVMDSINPTEDYWHSHSSIFIDPPPPDETAPEDSELFYDPLRSPVPLFITERAMIDVVGSAYPGTLIDSLWFIFTNTEKLKNWTASETLFRFQDFENDITIAVHGSQVSSAIVTILKNFKNRHSLAQLPLLLMTAILVITVLFLLSMMVSILVKHRENDTSLLKSRGAGVFKICRLYIIEALILTGTAALVSPFLAIGIVAISGFTPGLMPPGNSDWMPVALHPIPFIITAFSCLLCLIIYVLPCIFSTRLNVLSQKLRSSRPSNNPILHRYFLDLTVLLIAGILFWELHSRGQIISGGLFEETNLNEVMLFAPILFLAGISLVFMRIFPLLIRYLSGQSHQLIHILVLYSLIVLTLSEYWGDGIWDNWSIGSLNYAGMLACLALAYVVTARAKTTKSQSMGILAQTVLVIGLFLNISNPEGAITKIALVCVSTVVPCQILFLIIRHVFEAYPVWASLGLINMGRNPFQYTWIILLIILVSGSVVLATTVGITLEKTLIDKINYTTPTDIRIVGIPSYLTTGQTSIVGHESDMSGVVASVKGMREIASIDSFQAELLALETRDFSHMAWYRSDFSDNSLQDVMSLIHNARQIEGLHVPDGFPNLGIWIKPQHKYKNLSLSILISDATGRVRSVYMGNLDNNIWRLMTGQIPPMDPPLQIVSVQIYEPGLGPIGTPGIIRIDDLHATDNTGTKILLEDFETELNWSTIITSPVASEHLTLTSTTFDTGNKSLEFSFGRTNQRGIRGFYRSPTSNPLPVAISTRLAERIGAVKGDRVLLKIRQNYVEASVIDILHHFPTMGAADNQFIVADLNILTKHLNILSPASLYKPNELFIAADSTAGMEFDLALANIRQVSAQVLNRTKAIEIMTQDPLIRAGWRGMSVAASGIALLAGGLGYLIYIVALASNNKHEFGLLLHMGMSRKQLLCLLNFEHITILTTGLVLGTWAGFQISRLIVSSVSTDRNGTEQIPPLLLSTNWYAMLAGYGILLSICATLVLIVNQNLNKRQLHAIARISGN